MKVIDKVAFMVHEPTMYAHYSSVWAEMDPAEFVIVLTGPIARLDGRVDAHARDFIGKTRALGYQVVYLDETVHRRIKYRFVVSNHIISGRGAQPGTYRPRERLERWLKDKVRAGVNRVRAAAGLPRKYVYNLDRAQHPPLQAGLRQIRFMYGADISDAWSLDAWNAIYDLFMCHGPNDAMHLKSRFNGRTAIMGYPRYDGYFAPGLDTGAVSAEFGIDPGKQTLLWMPTFDMFKDNACSIPFFAKELAALNDDFNIIVRPHPISFRDDPAGIALLESHGFRIDRDPLRDMNALFKVADIVLCDHGGSAFGALYLGKKLVFLKTPTPESATVLKESSNKELMQHFPALDPGEVGRLRELARDESYWQAKLIEARVLSDRYFADYRGSSAQHAAAILGDLGAMFAGEEEVAR